MSVSVNLSICVRFPCSEIESTSLQDAGEYGLRKIVKIYNEDEGMDVIEMAQNGIHAEITIDDKSQYSEAPLIMFGADAVNHIPDSEEYVVSFGTVDILSSLSLDAINLAINNTIQSVYDFDCQDCLVDVQKDGGWGNIIEAEVVTINFNSQNNNSIDI